MLAFLLCYSLSEIRADSSFSQPCVERVVETMLLPNDGRSRLISSSLSSIPLLARPCLKMRAVAAFAGLVAVAAQVTPQPTSPVGTGPWTPSSLTGITFDVTNLASANNM